MSEPTEPEDLEETMASPVSMVLDPRVDLKRMLGEIEWMLKEGGVVASLTSRGINASLALLVVQGLRAYVIDDDKAQAAQDFSTAAEEIFSRLAASALADAKEKK